MNQDLLTELLAPLKSPIPKDSLREQTLQLLISDRSDDELQEPLLELLGYECLETDCIGILISMRDELKAQYLSKQP